MLSPGDDVVAANSGPFLHEDVMSLKGLEVIAEQPDPVQSAPEPATVIPPPVTQDPKPAEKKSVKPKWLKMWYDHIKWALCALFDYGLFHLGYLSSSQPAKKRNI